VTPAVRRHVHLTPVSAVRVAAAAVAVLTLLVALDRSRLVLHWLVTAAAAALLLDGLVRALARWVRRGLAVAAVTVLTLVGAALLTYGVVDAAVEQYDALRESAPEAALALEESDRVGGLAQRMRLAERTDLLVEQAPERVFGSPADAAQTAAERLGEVALVVTLAVFILVAYERFEQRILDVDEASRRGLGRWVGLNAGVTAGARSARLAVGRVVVLGAVVGAVAQIADVRAPMALGLWMAWWRLLPVLGVVVGYAPLGLLLVTDRPELVAAVVVLVLGGAEALVHRIFGTAASPGGLGVPMGVLTLVGFSAGVEMAGIVGAVVAVVVVRVLVGAVRSTVEPGPGLDPVVELGPQPL
jgi:predicted PurR-regulated permease PerM